MNTHPDSYFKHYTSVSEMLTMARGESPNQNRARSGLARDAAWAGTKTMQEALDLAGAGWASGLEQISRARQSIAVPIQPDAFNITPRFDEEGDEVAVDRWLGGESDHWHSFPMTRQPARGRIAHIAVNIAASASFSPEQLSRRGAAVAAMVDALEAAGVRCEVTAVFGASSDCVRGDDNIPPDDVRLMLISVAVKAAEDALDLERLAFWLMHPAALRRLMFRAMEQADRARFDHFADDYGYPTNAPAGWYDDDTIYLPALRSSRGAEEQIERVSRIVDQWASPDKLEGAK